MLTDPSYGGLVITEVAAKEPQRLSQLVYFDTRLPLKGENEIAL
jgi:pimeloyl-ACP methyl ester carboxylesterase